MTKEEIKNLFTAAKKQVPFWGIATNPNYTDAEVREEVLQKLHKIIFEAIEPNSLIGPMRQPGESTEDAIRKLALRHTGYVPDAEIKEILEAAFEIRKHRQ